MRIKHDLKLRKVGRKYMVVELSDQGTNLTNVYTMNETAACLWKKIGDAEFSEQELVNYLCEEYEVTEGQAVLDVDLLVKEWIKFGLVQ